MTALRLTNCSLETGDLIILDRFSSVYHFCMPFRDAALRQLSCNNREQLMWAWASFHLQLNASPTVFKCKPLHIVIWGQWVNSFLYWLMLPKKFNFDSTVKRPALRNVWRNKPGVRLRKDVDFFCHNTVFTKKLRAASALLRAILASLGPATRAPCDHLYLYGQRFSPTVLILWRLRCQD